MKSECTQKVTDKFIVFSERSSKITFVNTYEIKAVKITVDGCEIIEGIRCDIS